MGLNFRRSVRLGKHLRVNFSKSGASVSAGVKGARVSVGKRGVRTTASIPGSGISYTKQYGWNKTKQRTNGDTAVEPAMFYPVPEGVERPKTPKKIIYCVAAGFIFMFIGFINVLFLPLSLITLIIGIIMMPFSKEFKTGYFLQYAIKDYTRGNFESSYRLANKALKYKPDNESAKILINSINSFYE